MAGLVIAARGHRALHGAQADASRLGGELGGLRARGFWAAFLGICATWRRFQLRLDQWLTFQGYRRSLSGCEMAATEIPRQSEDQWRLAGSCLPFTGLGPNS